MIARRTLIAWLAGMTFAAPAAADDYPARPVRMITPFTASSPVDVAARLLAQHLSIALRQSVVVENKPGAGTTIGMKSVTLADPDGYTLLFQSSSLVVAPAMYKNLDFDPGRSFVPVANVAYGSWVTIVPPPLPVTTPRELIAYAKANPGKLNFGYGQGTAPQLVGTWFHKINGMTVTDVPYKGGAQAVTDMLGGSIHINIGTLATLLPLIRAGKVRAIGNWSEQRSHDLPEVATMIESGFPELSVGFWVGLWAPAGTPGAALNKLNAATNIALASPEMKASMQRLGVEGRPGSSKAFADFIAAETPKWAEFVKVSGVRVN